MRDEKDEVRRLPGYLPRDFGLHPNVTACELFDHVAQLKGLSVKAQGRSRPRQQLIDRKPGNMAGVELH